MRHGSSSSRPRALVDVGRSSSRSRRSTSASRKTTQQDTRRRSRSKPSSGWPKRGSTSASGWRRILAGLSVQPGEPSRRPRSTRSGDAGSRRASSTAVRAARALLEALAQDWPEKVARYEALFVQRRVPARPGHEADRRHVRAASRSVASSRTRRIAKRSPPPKPLQLALTIEQKPTEPPRGISNVADEVTASSRNDPRGRARGSPPGASPLPSIRVIGEACDGAAAVTLTRDAPGRS